VKLTSLLVLIFCNLVWSANPSMAKIVMMSGFDPLHVAWFRYVSSLLAYAFVVIYLSFAPVHSSRFGSKFIFKAKTRQWVLLALLGILTFCFTPILYMSGLFASRATDSTLLTVMEPLGAVFLAWVFLGESISWRHFVSFVLATLGFFLLSGISLDRSVPLLNGHLIGNLLIVVAIVGESAYSVIGRRLVSVFSPLAVFGTGLLIGVIFLTAVVFYYAGLPNLGALTPKGCLAVLWMGPIGTTFSYLYWIMVLREATVASVVLTLFIQPIVGFFCGYVFFGERLTAMQAVGGLIILLAVFAQSAFRSKKRLAGGSISNARR
jgi:drug/metabolite transporter (DMT)-like permease